MSFVPRSKSQTFCFPRSIERGPIEAASCWHPPHDPLSFPRSIERGPIEAGPYLLPCLPSSAFRVQLNAAPLKLLLHASRGAYRHVFPRSIERGPIEAPNTPAGRTLTCGFPRSIERGPIEAAFTSPPTTARPPTFRDQLVAAFFIWVFKKRSL